MSAGKRRSERDQRRRSLGQNFLVDQRLIAALISDLDLAADDLVVDLGAGTGALTLPLAAAGAQVWAVERDRVWADRLHTSVAEAGLQSSVRVIRADLRSLRLPRKPFRVVANPPFNLTTRLLGALLDDPTTPMTRADLLLQRDVVVKHATQPPRALKTARWAPWWQFRHGRRVPAAAFRPRPSVDAAVLRIERRDPPVLPEWLSADFERILRSSWQPPHS